ncbi:MAG: aldehyde dehydrogenase family protein, partial [Acidimicrobiales bacterium]|nr:aldehyde dehydrogenase family protein [Acidimicrobiales bacterium]
DRRLRKVSFTGSTEVGRRIVAASATNLLRVSMELGGDAPFLVFADADLDAAVEGAMLAKLRNGGEACTAANRFLVHESVADAFAERLAERFAGLRVGRGTEPGMDVGPLIDDDGRAKVASAVAAAVAAGADVRIGGDAVDGPGYFYAPTVLSGVGDVDGLRGVELFGPVAPIRAFGDDDEAFALANDTDYGLVAYAYTRDLRRTMALPERLEVGMIGVNRGLVSNAAAPFGGVKHSGFGREGGPEGLREYLETTYLAIDES